MPPPHGGACLTASGATSEVPSFLMHPCHPPSPFQMRPAVCHSQHPLEASLPPSVAPGCVLPCTSSRRLEQEKEVLKHQLESYKADNEAIVASMSSGGASGDVPPSEYGHFYRNKAELESWLRERKAFYNVATQGDHKTADLDRLRAEFDNYKNTDRQRRRVMHREMEDLASDMRSRRCREPCDTEDLDRAWADLETAERMYMDALHDEEIRRNIQGHHKAEFRDEAARLVDWCRMQKANLMVLEDPDQIQEFCASLQNTFVQMESNLEVRPPPPLGRRKWYSGRAGGRAGGRARGGGGGGSRSPENLGGIGKRDSKGHTFMSCE